jgi:uncharacterized delta-60 repeat protein
MLAATAAAILLVAPAATALGRSGRTSATHSRPFPQSYNRAYALAIMPDGKIVAVGASECLHTGCNIEWAGTALARYLPNGRLDSSFGRRGRVLTDGGLDPNAAAIQADGKIVAVGEGNLTEFALARYTRRGRLDASFGKGGIVDDATLRPECEPWAEAAAVQGDGKIVVTGLCNADDPVNGFFTARYDNAGRLDPSFGRGGSVLTDFGAGTYADGLAVAIQPDGKILVGGVVTAGSPAQDDVALTRYLPDGRLDPGFGNGGKVFDAPGEASTLALQADGKIIAADGGGVARLEPDGSLDTGFGSGGRVTPGFSFRSLAVQGDGKIVVAGSLQRGNHYEFALRRYSSNGSSDPDFANGGPVFTRFGKRSSDEAAGVAVQADGKIVLAGGTEPRGGLTFEAYLALARYTVGGPLDPQFGKAGKVLTDFHRLTGFESFSATRTKQGVLLRWRTNWENGIRGFRLYQGKLNKPMVRITRTLIASKGGASRGASYSFRDPGTPHAEWRFRFFLEEVRRDGTSFIRGQTPVP